MLLVPHAARAAATAACRWLVVALGSEGPELRLVPPGGEVRPKVGQVTGSLQQQDGLPRRGELQHHGGVRLPGVVWGAIAAGFSRKDIDCDWAE